MAGVDVTGNQDCLSSLGEQDSVLLTSLWRHDVCIPRNAL